MAIIKCKMCGGDMEISEDKTFGVCEYCGTSMTLPKVDNEQRAAAFNRGNHFRRIGEFDKALAVYERIVAEDNSDAEAHWCCALCRFGIEYVEDPTTYEWLPTCHRASFDNFLEDVDYLAAVEYSDGITRRQYQKDAAKIAQVQRGILATSQKEEPFDVFICYKESDENGQRTVDSTLAQDIYYQLTDKGRRVFFARITLEDKGGTEYEPYIFAALNSAKVMVVVGTSAEHFNAVWVKNEWSRFLSLMKKDHSKLLLPCYRDMDPYDLPDQLSVLQSYDMSKIGFIQDLIRGIDKVLDADKQPEAKQETVVVQGEGGGNISALIKRGNMALEDGDWSKADGFFDRVLDNDAECAEAYLGKALAEAKAASLNQLRGKFLPVLGQISPVKVEVDIPGHEEQEERLATENVVPGYLEREELQEVFVFDFCYASCSDGYEQQMKRSLLNLADNRNLSRAERYASGALKAEIASFKESIKSETEQTLSEAHTKDEQSEKDVREHYEQTFAQWEQQANQMRSDAEARRERDYQKAIVLFEDEKYDQALAQFQMPKLIEYRETANYIEQIEKAKEDKERRRAEEAARLEVLKKKEQAEKKKRAIKISIIVGCIAAIVAAAIVVVLVVVPTFKYSEAEELLAAGKFDDAIAAFTDLGDYEDASEQVTYCYYQKASALLNEGQYDYAATIFESLGDYQDAAEQVLNCYYQQAIALADEGQYSDAIVMFGKVADYSDANQRLMDVWSVLTQRDTISCGDAYTVGIKSDGTVVAVGNNSYGQCNVSGWEDIVAVSAGASHTVGLKSDGTVVAVGDNSYGQCDISDWADIVAVSAGASHTVGLKSDGTVVTVGKNLYGQCDISDWADIVAVSAGSNHTIGLKSDGTVVAVGNSLYNQCDVSEWADIVVVSAGSNHTTGLKSDGTITADGSSLYDQCDLSDWVDIVAVSAGLYHTVGLKSDGTVVAVGNNSYGQCDVSNWTDIKVPG